MFCSLATRFYDSVNGHIDSKGKEPKELSPVQTQNWLSRKREEQKQRASSVHSTSLLRPKAQLPSLPSGPRGSSPKLHGNPLPSVRKVAKASPVIPTKKPEARDYEEASEEELEEDSHSSPTHNQ